MKIIIMEDFVEYVTMHISVILFFFNNFDYCIIKDILFVFFFLFLL